MPSFTGVKVLEDIDLEVLSQYIDWTPFFISWDLAGKFPRILTDEVVGEEVGVDRERQRDAFSHAPACSGDDGDFALQTRGCAHC